jgi:hypothetical protein
MGAESQINQDDFSALLADVRTRIQSAQARAMSAVNSELVRLYWDIDRIIDHRQKREGWGAAVIPRLSAALKNELPEVKGFSQRNIKRMLAFFRAYPEPSTIVPPPVAQSDSGGKVPQPVAQIPESLLWTVHPPGLCYFACTLRRVFSFRRRLQMKGPLCLETYFSKCDQPQERIRKNLVELDYGERE